MAAQDLGTSLADAMVVQAADKGRVLWARVKGYPHWPAQVMSDMEAAKRLRGVRQGREQTLPVMFFGTLEIAWVAPGDVASWGLGMAAAYHTRAKARKQFTLAISQVHDFLVRTRKRRAPERWWTHPPRLLPKTKPKVVANHAELCEAPVRRAAATDKLAPDSNGARAAATVGSTGVKGGTKRKVHSQAQDLQHQDEDQHAAGHDRTGCNKRLATRPLATAANRCHRKGKRIPKDAKADIEGRESTRGSVCLVTTKVPAVESAPRAATADAGAVVAASPLSRMDQPQAGGSIVPAVGLECQGEVLQAAGCGACSANAQSDNEARGVSAVSRGASRVKGNHAVAHSPSLKGPRVPALASRQHDEDTSVADNTEPEGLLDVLTAAEAVASHLGQPSTSLSVQPVRSSSHLASGAGLPDADHKQESSLVVVPPPDAVMASTCFSEPKLLPALDSDRPVDQDLPGILPADSMPGVLAGVRRRSAARKRVCGRGEASNAPPQLLLACERPDAPPAERRPRASGSLAVAAGAPPVTSSSKSQAPPVYEHLRRNLWVSRDRPRRLPKDQIAVCSCCSDTSTALTSRGRSAPDAKHSQRPMSAPPAGASSARIAPPLDTSRAVREGAGPLDLLEGSTLLAQSGTGREEPVEGEARHLADAVLPADDDNATLRAPPPLRDGCAANCLNRLSFIHCDPRLCPYGDRCSNRPFHLLRMPKLEVFLTDNRGWGVRAVDMMQRGDFICEYVGEIVSDADCRERMRAAKEAGEPDFYMMELGPGLIIDARTRGNVARFINSACVPNCETQKWHDAATGEIRIGIFAATDILPGTELTYDYQFQHYGLAAAAGAYRCMCGAPACRGTMDTQPERFRDFGKRIEVFWDGDSVFYRGTVTGYSATSRKHTILYDDNDVERVCLEVVPHRWLDENAQMKLSPLPANVDPSMAARSHCKDLKYVPALAAADERLAPTAIAHKATAFSRKGPTKTSKRKRPVQRRKLFAQSAAGMPTTDAAQLPTSGNIFEGPRITSAASQPLVPRMAELEQKAGEGMDSKGLVPKHKMWLKRMSQECQPLPRHAASTPSSPSSTHGRAPLAPVRPPGVGR